VSIEELNYEIAQWKPRVKITKKIVFTQCSLQQERKLKVGLYLEAWNSWRTTGSLDRIHTTYSVSHFSINLSGSWTYTGCKQRSPKIYTFSKQWIENNTGTIMEE